MDNKKKFKKIGVVLRSDDQEKAPFIILGSSNNKDPKYNLDVGLRVVDNEGKELAKLKNCIITLRDPRNNPNLTEEKRAKISPKVLYDLGVWVD